MNEPSQPAKNPTPETTCPTPAKKCSAWRPVLILVGVFLVGFAPVWLKSSRLNGQLLRAERQVRLERIQLTFANAVLDARRGEYEPARQNMASFFSQVAAEQERGLDSALPSESSDAIKVLLTQRDDLITLLARGDPASAERLATAYSNFRKALGK